MRIAYCTNIRLPSERAHGLQVAQVCDALAVLGHEVEIFCPYRKNPVTEDFGTYYGMKHRIPLHLLGNLDPIDAKWLPGVLGLFVLNWLLRRASIPALAKEKFDVIYTRSPALLSALLKANIPVILELHRLPRFGLRSFVSNCRRCKLIVCLTRFMREELIRWGVREVPIIVESDGVNLARFVNLPSQEESRQRLRTTCNLQPATFNSQTVIGYAGQLKSMGLSKGIPELLKACEILEKEHVPFHAVIAGGPESSRQAFEASLPEKLRSSVRFLGMLPPLQIPAFLSACDLLVYPAPKSSDRYYLRDTSPLKIFEYMAAGKPIVCADLPPLRDILTDEMAFFCAPGDPKSLADAIREVLRSPEEAMKRAGKAKEHVQQFSWEKRMQSILDSIAISEEPRTS